MRSAESSTARLSSLRARLSCEVTRFHEKVGGSFLTELASFFARYAERYMDSDADAVGELCEAPFLAVREGRAIHLADRAAVREHFSEVMAAYARSGAVRAEIHGLTVEPLGKSSANATVHWQVRSADGGLLKDFRTTYHMLLVESRW
ncbi:MAG TPA: hypothetical protein VE985_07270 [Gaiellaceae bacterium]|nr:hypothetical protein [Gaiellaceae bacterium]